jgi:hypothetical protein
MKESGTARRARIFHSRARNTFESRRRANVRSEVILSDKRRSGEIAQIERLNCVRGYIPICQSVLDRLNR